MMLRMTGVGDITICPMSDTDLDEVLAIEAVSYPKPWTREHFLDELNSPFASPLVALDGEGRVAGYLCPMLLLDEAQILNVAVRPDLRSHGLGRLLIESLLDDYRNRGASVLSLEVRVSNEPARTLYRKLGFTETGRRPKYYENGEDAILMEYIFDQPGDGNAV